ncbi:uncharacterized protein LOC129777614 isoform X2 [Toxorhynchites rutilus septentrionalis]|nr:uncharacterized protein LOC129777614 isoform X2 [Toxorhynchites rutilus septentrionalis]
MNRLEGSNEIITCSSFESYNALTEERQECTSIKVTEHDSNVDGKTDILKASVSFNLPDDSLGLAFYSLYFFLETSLESNCRFLIPTFISLNKLSPPVAPFTSGTIHHAGHLEASQMVSLQCPFFMRNIKTHFSHNYFPNENFTSVEDFLPESIQNKIESSNAAHFHLGQRKIHWKRDGSGEITISVEVLIGREDSRHTALLYNSSIWQMVAQFWVQYFSVLAVSFWIANRVKDWLFESSTIRAMEIVPWKEKMKVM